MLAEWSIASTINNHRRSLFVLASYILLSVLMTWPLAAKLGEVVPAGAGGDVWGHLWTFWWVKKALAEGINPYYTDLLFHPHGVSLTTHNIAWLNIALWLPVQALVGEIAAYSLVYLVAFPLNASAMYLLVREWTGSEPAAAIGGLIYGFWPYAVSQFGHPNMIILFWIPLSLLFLRRTLDKGRWQDGLLAAICIAMTGFVRWQLLIMAMVLVGMYVIYWLTTNGVWASRRALISAGVVLLGAMVIMAPLAIPIIVAQVNGDQPEEFLVDEASTGRTDLMAYFLPNEDLTLAGRIVPLLPAGLRFEDFRTEVEFLGYMTLALALFGVLRNWRSARFWLLATAVFMLMALGPELQVGGKVFSGVPMPYRMVEDLFFVRVLRFPHRFNIVLALPMAMLAALGVQALFRNRSTNLKSVTLVAVIAVVILGEYWLAPYRTERPATPAWYVELARETGDFAILDLPMEPRAADKSYMLYQMTHGKQLVEGHVSRPPAEAFSFINNTPLLETLRQGGGVDPALVDVGHQLSLLADANIRYLVLHKALASEEQLESWQDWLTIEPYHEDDELIVYRTKPLLGQDLFLTNLVTDEIGLVRTAYHPDETSQAGTIRVEARWASQEQPDRDYDACLRLVSNKGEIAQDECQVLGGGWPTSRWKAGDLARTDYNIRVDPFLEPGAYTLALALVERGTGEDAGQQVPLGALKVTELPRVFEAPDTAQPLGAHWAEVIALPGYSLQESDGSLALTLYWKALRRMETSYKVFVHLVDTTSGSLVAQSDFVPRDWSYPTTWWEKGEIVEDSITLQVNDIPSGEYRLLIGLYDEESGKRLPVFSAGGEPYPGDAVQLTIRQR